MCHDTYQIAALTNGSLACVNTNETSLIFEDSFRITDVNDMFVKDTGSELVKITLSESLLGTLTTFVSPNIVESMSTATLPSIITFAMGFGTVAGRNFFTKARRINYLYLVLLQLRNTFFLAMEWIIWMTPIGVISLIGGAIAANRISLNDAMGAYMYVVAIFIAGVFQMLILYPMIVFLLTRCNPFKHMFHMIRAYAFAFACSSSLATAPVTLSCVRQAKVCSLSLANFVISLGVSSNTSAMCFYTPIGVIFLAESSGLHEEITAMRVLALCVLTAFAAIGTPPVPNGGLVVVVTIFRAVFGAEEAPATFA